jgi:uncharacterized protein involved in type VI secretion and phage assembly
MTNRPLFGKHRGTVVNNIDPMQIGRVQVSVPDVTGLAQNIWAMPCVPVAGVNSGIYVVPANGSAVWVEFEQGNRDRAIWVGGFWRSAADVPAHLGAASVVVRTTSQNELVISDEHGPNGGIRIRTATGAMISVSDAGIVITNGRGAVISMSGPTVDVNSGAFTVT